jgi:hypothetical protein
VRIAYGAYMPWRRPALLLITVLWLAVGSPIVGHAQRRLDAPGVHACTTVAQLATELRSRTVPAEQARARLQMVYDIARTSGTPSVRQVAEAHLPQVARADETLLLAMAEQFRDACR